MITKLPEDVVAQVHQLEEDRAVLMATREGMTDPAEFQALASEDSRRRMQIAKVKADGAARLLAERTAEVEGLKKEEDRLCAEREAAAAALEAGRERMEVAEAAFIEAKNRYEDLADDVNTANIRITENRRRLKAAQDRLRDAAFTSTYFADELSRG